MTSRLLESLVWLRTHPSLSALARLVGAMIASHCAGLTASWKLYIRELQADCKLSRSSVDRAVKELQADGFIEVIRHRDTRHPSEYRLLRPWEARHTDEPEASQSTAIYVQEPNDPGPRKDTSNKEEKNESKSEGGCEGGWHVQIFD